MLFLPAAGFRIESDLCDAGECGKYWSSVLHRGCACACCLFFVSNCNHLDNDFRGDGFSVRAVAVSTE